MSIRTPKKLSPVISVINMKGGVGKTTLTGNLFREIFRSYRKSVLLIDFDPQFNLTQLLISRTKYETLKVEERTIWNILEPKNTNFTSISDNETIEVKGLDTKVWNLRFLTDDPRIKLDLLIGDFSICQYNLREKADTLRLPRARFKSLIDVARLKYDLIIIDCNPSSSFLTRTAIENSDHLLIPVRPDKYSLLGVEMILDFMGKLHGLSNKPNYSIVLNGMTDSRSDLRIESELRSHTTFGAETLVNSVPKTDLLAARVDLVGFAVDRKVKNRNILRMALLKIATEIVKKLGLV
jgi:chromosome partitioning protein